jgi:hypothetical protein
VNEVTSEQANETQQTTNNVFFFSTTMITSAYTIYQKINGQDENYLGVRIDCDYSTPNIVDISTYTVSGKDSGHIQLTYDEARDLYKILGTILGK